MTVDKSAPASAGPPAITMFDPLATRAHFACLDEDEAEAIAADLVEDIMQKSQDILFEKHISSQVVPYAVQFAKETFLRMAMWAFFDEDRVDVNHPMWKPDEGTYCLQSRVPAPVEIDSWARGTLFPIDQRNTIKPVIPWCSDRSASPSTAPVAESSAVTTPSSPRKSLLSAATASSPTTPIAPQSPRRSIATGRGSMAGTSAGGAEARPRIWQP
ncbi:hypothetical protein AMAG_09136 [Allomyces macrogynus ATCC 38327]|uniref:Uncharacterized protein n=1 Tax=Allomyces macrogynus (strain ATCC 38327) TaxID=578462 RepID=A0A0L0SNJ5_ALLM3|nr:hypothetical protein AMAG_09136 [Allomyces macrogynus ATCC 38327]|eukprot:KNE64078.1 hypothetical protein AMAG_09136 [Allomyces macrogynus ATCC 38327]